MRLALVIILALFPYMCLQAKEEVSAWNRTVPRGPDDLLEIQERMQSLLPKVRKALVSIESNGGAGSGIIVSEDGLVLTAAHVHWVQRQNHERAPAQREKTSGR